MENDLYVLLENGKAICAPASYEIINDVMHQIINELCAGNDARIYHCCSSTGYKDNDVVIAVQLENTCVLINYKIEGSTLKGVK